jgi:plastocyanin
MSNRFWPGAVLAGLLLAVALVGGTAIAKSSKAPNKATVTASGKFSSKFKINRLGVFTDSSHFTPGAVVIRSGGTLTLKNKANDPHTFSIVTKKDLPKTRGQLNNCGAPNTICSKLNLAHQVDQQGNPAKPVVDIGTAGVDQPGDSFVLSPKGSQTVNLSAKSGTTLYFMCGIHPWMQGTLKVR